MEKQAASHSEQHKRYVTNPALLKYRLYYCLDMGERASQIRDPVYRSVVVVFVRSGI
jgi:hypothetical protein